MILGIISDTHDKLKRTKLAVSMLQDAGAEALIHCGDFEEPHMLSACAVLPLWFVFGNNDSDSDLRLAAVDSGAVCLEWGGVVELAGKRIGVTHGHLTTELRNVLNQKPEYLLYGHSHDASEHRENGVRYINPGALHRATEFTVAFLDLKSDELKWLTVPR
jgi:uncharacterized protein